MNFSDLSPSEISVYNANVRLLMKSFGATKEEAEAEALLKAKSNRAVVKKVGNFKH